MTATNIVLTEAQMKQAANRMKADIRVRLEEGKSVSHAWLLESMSKGLFGKPFNEARSTLLAAPVEKRSPGTRSNNVAPRVLLIDYGSETFLTLDGQYVTSTCPGTDMELSDSAIQRQAGTLANLHNTWGHRVELPELLNEDWEADDVIDLAKMLGYFRYARPLHELLDKGPLVIFKGAAERWALDGGYVDVFQSYADEGQPWRDTFKQEIVWTPEFEAGGDKYELYLTFDELGAAKEASPNVWVLPYRTLDGSESQHIEIRLVLEG